MNLESPHKHFTLRNEKDFRRTFCIPSRITFKIRPLLIFCTHGRNMDGNPTNFQAILRWQTFMYSHISYLATILCPCDFRPILLRQWFFLYKLWRKQNEITSIHEGSSWVRGFLKKLVLEVLQCLRDLLYIYKMLRFSVDFSSLKRIKKMGRMGGKTLCKFVHRTVFRIWPIRLLLF
jgi:hypothetical protein